MTERNRFRPFTGDTSRRILLKSAPLELVLCQIRWPELAHLQGDIRSMALEFGAALDDYPVYEEGQEVTYNISPEGVHRADGGAVYQWRSVDGIWHVSLGRRFVSLYCTRYESYGVFSERLQKVIENLAVTLKIPLVDRVGFRYVNRLSDPQIIENLSEYVRPEVLGYSELTAESSDVRLVGSSNQARFLVDGLSLQVRSGIVPVGETVDAAIVPLDVNSWVLDLDAFNEVTAPFDVDGILVNAGKLSDMAYDFFKKITTDGFIREFGGEP